MNVTISPLKMTTPIFEIPFLKNSSGEVGYTFGPSVATDANGFTPHPWEGAVAAVFICILYTYLALTARIFVVISRFPLEL